VVEDLRAAQARAAAAYLAADRAAGKVALGETRRALRQWESELRRACRGGKPAAAGQETDEACSALERLVKVADGMEDRLDAREPSLRLVDALDDLARELAAQLGVTLALSPLGQVAPVRLDWAPAGAEPALREASRGAGDYYACRPGPAVTVEPAGSGVVDLHLAADPAGPILAVRRDCTLASPPCARPGVALRRLDAAGQPGTATELDVTGWDEAEGLRVVGGAAPALLHFRERDLLRLPLGPDLRPAGPAHLVLAHADGLRTERFAPGPEAAALSVEGDGRRLSLVLLGPGHRPRAVVRLTTERAEDQASGAGQPAVVRAGEDLLVAFSTLRGTRVARITAAGRPAGPATTVPYPRSLGVLDPVASALGVHPGGVRLVTLLRRGSGEEVLLLADLDPALRLLRPATQAAVPLRSGQPVDLQVLAARRRTAVLLRGRAPLHEDRHPVLIVELSADGARVGEPRTLALAARYGGAAEVPGGAVLAWQDDDEGRAPGSPGEVRTAAVQALRLTCEGR
jgi:hypothetical protein